MPNKKPVKKKKTLKTAEGWQGYADISSLTEKKIKAWAVLKNNNRAIEGTNAYVLVIYNRRRDAQKFHTQEIVPCTITYSLPKSKK